jgi:hypothetical protein
MLSMRILQIFLKNVLREHLLPIGVLGIWSLKALRLQLGLRLKTSGFLELRLRNRLKTSGFLELRLRLRLRPQQLRKTDGTFLLRWVEWDNEEVVVDERRSGHRKRDALPIVDDRKKP